MPKPLVIVSGCSYNPVFYSIPEYHSDIEFINLGQAGRSNHWISHSVQWYLEQRRPSSCLVLVSWTSIDRRDILIDGNLNSTHSSINYEQYSDPKYFTGRFRFRLPQWYDQQEDIQPIGLLSLTNLVSDPDSNWVLERIAGNYHKYIQNERQSWQSSLISWVLLEQYCRSRKYTYISTVWQDVFHSTSKEYFQRGQSVSNVIADYRQLECRNQKFPELSYLFNQLNLANWRFCASRHSHYAGIADWAIDRGLFGNPEYGDNEHPSPQGYQRYYKEILSNDVNKFIQHSSCI